MTARKSFGFSLEILLLVTMLMPRYASATLIGDLPGDLASPVTTKASTAFYVGMGLTLAAVALEDSISDPLQKEVTSNRPLGKYASDLGVLAGPLLPNIAYIVGMASFGYLAGDSNAKSRSLIMTKTSIIAPLVTDAMKYVLNEPRPDGSDNYSFPSGHTTGAFAFASVVASEHEWYWGALAYSYATLVGYSRMNDNRHYLHDIIAGATIGTSYGMGLYFRSHAKDGATPVKSAYDLKVLPTDDFHGLVALYRIEI
jgi:membrane-associated phospholipid phosphatase